MGPVAFRGNQWVGYDDIEMVKKKAEYVAENGLGGKKFSRYKLCPKISWKYMILWLSHMNINIK